MSDGGVQWHQQLGQQEEYELSTPKVYEAINRVQAALAKVGISKDGVNTSQNYKFRGIDQVYAALSPLLADHGLCVLPRVLSHERTERVTMKPGYQGQPAKESVLFYVTVDVEFDFVAVADGSKHTVRTAGEAMDSGDKATNKAMSAAYKYAAFMAFAIPTEGDNDADAHSHSVEPQYDVPPARMKELETLAADMLALQEEGREMAAASAFYALPDQADKMAVWGMLKGQGGGSTPESRLRSFIKANKPEKDGGQITGRIAQE